MVTVRSRLVADLPACVAALAQVHRVDGYPSRWPADPAGWLTPRQMLAAWVVDGSDTVDGHVALTDAVDAALARAAGQPAAELAVVSRLFVRPAARGQRLGAVRDHRVVRAAGLAAGRAPFSRLAHASWEPAAAAPLRALVRAAPAHYLCRLTSGQWAGVSVVRRRKLRWSRSFGATSTRRPRRGRTRT